MIFRKLVLILLVPLALPSQAAQAQTWKNIGTVPLYGEGTCFYFWDTATGVAGGPSRSDGLYYYRSGVWAEAVVPYTVRSVSALRLLDPSHLYAIGSSLLVSTDSGATWTDPYFDTTCGCDTVYGAYGYDLYRDKNDTLNFLSGNSHTGWPHTVSGTTFSRLNEDTCVISVDDIAISPMYSTDGGITWDSSNAGSGYRAGFGIYADACAGIIYTANESGILYRSTDGGRTWQYVTSKSRDVLDGWEGTLYWQEPAGVYRSIDSGRTWQLIGGPKISIEDYRLFSWGPNGRWLVASQQYTNPQRSDIWLWDGGPATALSPAISITPSALFFGDTAMCDSIAGIANIRILACYPPSVTGLHITGRDSSYFRAWLAAPDSIVVQLVPNNHGQLQALLLIRLSDGWTDTITLGGYGNRPPTVLAITPRSLFLSDTIRCDSITRTVYVDRHGCDPLSVITASIIGSDSLCYHLGPLQGDSIRVTLLSNKTGRHQGSIVFQKSDGSWDTVSLGGYIIPNTIYIFPDTLFAGDTLQCDSMSTKLYELVTGCSPPVVKAVNIVGKDSSHFDVGSFVSGEIPITFHSQVRGDYGASAIISLSDGSLDTIVLRASARPRPDSLAIAPRTLFTGDTALCDPITRYVRLASTGCTPPSVASARIAGADAANYTLGSVRQDSIAVTLLPSTVGDHHAFLVLSRNDGRFDTVNLFGSVAPRPSTISILPRMLFASDTVRCDSVTRGISIHGAGCAPLAVSGFSLVGIDSSAYRLSALHSDSIDVTLASTVNGRHGASLVIEMSDGTRDTVVLAGQVQREPNALTLSATTLFVGDTARCDTITRSLSFTRTGCTPPSIASLSIAGKDSASYRLSTSGDSISISLLPVTSGGVSALLLARLSDGSVDTVQLAGACSNQGGNVAITPLALFGGDTLRCDSITRSVVYRTGGCVPPSLTTWSIAGNDAASFLARQDQDTFFVTLIPHREGNQHASLVLQFDDGTRDTVALSGVNAPARTMALDTTPINLGTLRPCESHDTAIPYTNTSCVAVDVRGWTLTSWGSGFNAFGTGTHPPYPIQSGASDSLHITFDGSHTGVVYDTVIVWFGTDADSVRRIPLQTFAPAIDTVNFLLSMPAQLAAGQHFAASVLPDRVVSGKGLTSVSGVFVFPDDDFSFDSITAPAELQLNWGGPWLVNGVDRVDFGVSNIAGLTLDPAQPIAQIWLRALLADTTNYRVSLDSVLLNGGDPNYSRCTLATGGTGATATLAPACGDSLLMKTMSGSELLLIDPPQPNPATDNVTIRFRNMVLQPIQYELYDALGTTRLRGVTQGSDIVLDVSSLPEGIYFFRASSAGAASVSRKIAIAR